MRAAGYVLLVLLSLSLLGLGFLWLIYYGSGHHIPVNTTRALAAVTLVNTGLLGLLWTGMRRVKRAARHREGGVL